MNGMNGEIEAAKLLRSAKCVTVLTGAGVSKESGIPTFRDALTGLWAQYDPEKLATAQGFLENPALVWQWYDGRRQLLAQVKPNAGHFALVELEKMVGRLTIITQNVDGLHRLAGSSSICELHGNIANIKCFDANHPASDIPFGLKEPPTCFCGSKLRPDVVWFGELLPEFQLAQAVQAAGKTDLMLVIGTSGLVYPAASLPYLASQHGARIIEINPEKTPITPITHLFLQGPSAQILPAIVSALIEMDDEKPIA
jgi:NAD-dependent deacetylase